MSFPSSHCFKLYLILLALCLSLVGSFVCVPRFQELFKQLAFLQLIYLFTLYVKVYWTSCYYPYSYRYDLYVVLYILWIVYVSFVSLHQVWGGAFTAYSC